MVGGYFGHPSLRSQELVDRSTKFKWRSIDLEICRGKPSFVDSRSTDDVTGQVKIKVFDYFAVSGFVAHNNRIKCKYASRTTWIVSGDF